MAPTPTPSSSWRSEPRRAWLCAALAVAGCERCDAPPPPEMPAAAAPPVAPEPWTLGASDVAWVLPPTCRVEESLATVAPRRTQLIALEGALEAAVAVEGHLTPTRGRPRWLPDAAGVVTMRHGSAGVLPLPWSVGAVVSGSPTTPHVALASDRGPSLWRDPTTSPLALPVDRVHHLACSGTRCAAAASRTGQHVVWLDEDVRDAAPGVVVELPDPAGGGRPALLELDEDDVVVGLESDLRLHLHRIDVELTVTPGAALPVAGGTLAALARPPVSLVRREAIGTRCEPDEGGVMVVTERGTPSRLRSPLPAREGTLHLLGGDDLLATWSSPVRCGSSREVLHAAVTDREGALRGPVVEVGPADDWAVSTRGDELALWMRRDGDGARPTIHYVRARCARGRDE